MGEKAAEMAAALKPGQVMLLENLRFYAEEEGKPRGLAEDATDEEKKAAKKALKEGPQKEFVKKMASYADCYINDAFGTAHRAHSSTALIADDFSQDANTEESCVNCIPDAWEGVDIASKGKELFAEEI